MNACIVGKLEELGDCDIDYQRLRDRLLRFFDTVYITLALNIRLPVSFQQSDTMTEEGVSEAEIWCRGHLTC